LEDCINANISLFIIHVANEINLTFYVIVIKRLKYQVVLLNNRKWLSK